MTRADNTPSQAVSGTEGADLFGPIPARTQPAPRGDQEKRARLPVALEPLRPAYRSKELTLFDCAQAIDNLSASDAGALGFLATAMIYASLPHSEVSGGVFKRRSGVHTLSIINDPDIGLPYGKLPRLITAFLCTEAKRYAEVRGREIHLGRSQAEFMSKLGLHSRGGVRGDITRVREQAKRLFTSTINLTKTVGREFQWESVRIARKGMILWSPHDTEARSQWHSTLLLTEEFFEECVAHAVPIDLRVLHALRSPMAIDLYVWLTYRLQSLPGPVSISWKQLQWQFGANYPTTPQGTRDFRSNCLAHLRSVLAIYQTARVAVRKDDLLLLPSPRHVLPGESSTPPLGSTAR